MSDFEKYGVSEDEEQVKIAEKETKRMCPSCGATLESEEKMNVLKCPNCGTEPFERGDG